MKTYAVKEVFPTVQGEGHWLGTPAVFVRFAGCNMWSGRAEDRERDAERNGAQCPRWCDTDFVGGEKLSSPDLVERIASHGYAPLVVFTGGEPLLQLDQELLEVMLDADHARRWVRTFAVETNGTVQPKFDNRDGSWTRPWVVMSPKQSRLQTVLCSVDELKLVYPGHDPEDWDSYPARYKWLQPLDPVTDRHFNWPIHMRQCVEYARTHPKWRVGVQAHKVWGVP